MRMRLCDMNSVSSCGSDPGHSPPSHHDSRRPGGDPHPRTCGGEPNDPTGPPTLCGQHPLWYHRGERRPRSGSKHLLDELARLLREIHSTFTHSSFVCRSPWWTSSMPRCVWVVSLRHLATLFLQFRSTRIRTLPSLRWERETYVIHSVLNSIFKEKPVLFTCSLFLCSFVQWMKQHRQWHLTASSFKARAWRSAVPTITSPCLAWARIPVSMCLVQRQFMVFNFF